MLVLFFFTKLVSHCSPCIQQLTRTVTNQYKNYIFLMCYYVFQLLLVCKILILIFLYVFCSMSLANVHFVFGNVLSFLHLKKTPFMRSQVNFINEQNDGKYLNLNVKCPCYLQYNIFICNAFIHAGAIFDCEV